MIHAVLIALHGLFGTAAFAAGSWMLSPLELATGRRRWLMPLFLVSLVGMVVSLALAMLSYWPNYSPVERPAFTLLFGLAIYMAVRGFQARRVYHLRAENWRGQLIGHIGFNLIALTNGFIIVLAMNMGAPPLLVGALAGLAIIIGNLALTRLHFSIKKLVVPG